ncbi:NEQ212 [Nanoarchaeum equitans Kin4-M]|uniref:NEQ212 n=1 Tax=Nanoarchaeum equitans (strain Kin4-M) TaxID=228908 RepID=Q74ND4_NANEQ|nr:NEQ212 [Nanoarchaeum equitans Kin4-M]
MVLKVVDSSYAIRADFIPKDSVTVKEAIKEIQKFDKEKAYSLIALEPKKEYIDLVKQNIKGEKLSKTDIKLLALAKQLNAILLTDDTDMQSVALRLGIKVKGYRITIEKPKKKRYRCPNCGRFYNKPYCPICGLRLNQ